MTKRRRGIYLLPNLFTTSALFAGFYAIVAAFNTRYEPAAIAVFVAMILDGMDGRIARMTKTESDFGVQYDSLSDMVSFGLAPALVAYQWSLHGMGKLGWLAAFIYAAAAALPPGQVQYPGRQRRQAIYPGITGSRRQATAAVIAGLVWFDSVGQPVDEATMAVFAFALTILIGLLMVSNIRYHSFKQIDLHGKVPFFSVLFIVLIIALVAVRPSLVLFLLALAYAVSGPLMTLVLIRRHRSKRVGVDSREQTTD